MAIDLSAFLQKNKKSTEEIEGISAAVEGLQKQLGSLRQAAYSVTKQKIEIKTNFSSMNEELMKAQKNFFMVGDAAKRQQKTMERLDFSRLKKEMASLDTSFSITTETFTSMSDNVTQSTGKVANKLSALKSSGLMDMMTDSATSLNTAIFNSALGTDAGGVLSNVINGALVGAGAGAFVGGIGAVPGAIIGAVSGLVKSAADFIGKEDEGFKSVVKSEYQRVTDERDRGMQRGISSASAQENIAGMLTRQYGNSDAAASIIQKSKDYAGTMPYDATSVSSAALQLSRYGVEQDMVMTRVQQLGDMAQGQASAFETLINAYSTMSANQKVSLPELNSMMGAGIPILEALANQCGVTEQDIVAMAQNGQINIQTLNQAMDSLTGAGGLYSGVGGQLLEEYNSLSTMKDNLEGNLNTAEGEEYIKSVLPEMKEYIEFLQGEGGQKLEEAYRLSGQSKGKVEGAKYREKTGALQDLVSGENSKFNEALAGGDGVSMDRLISGANIMGESNFHSSTEWGAQLENERQLIEYIQESTAENWKKYGEEAGKQFNKGRMSVPMSSYPLRPVGGTDMRFLGTLRDSGVNQPEKRSELPEPGTITPPKVQNDKGYPIIQGFGLIGGDAYGLPYVPYDNYAALLHQGERVLTAREARNYQDGGGVSINIGGMTVREEADIDRIAKTIVREIQYAKVGYGG